MCHIGWFLTHFHQSGKLPSLLGKISSEKQLNNSVFMSFLGVRDQNDRERQEDVVRVVYAGAGVKMSFVLIIIVFVGITMRNVSE